MACCIPAKAKNTGVLNVQRSPSASLISSGWLRHYPWPLCQTSLTYYHILLFELDKKNLPQIQQNVHETLRMSTTCYPSDPISETKGVITQINSLSPRVLHVMCAVIPYSSSPPKNTHTGSFHNLLLLPPRLFSLFLCFFSHQKLALPGLLQPAPLHLCLTHYCKPDSLSIRAESASAVDITS